MENTKDGWSTVTCANCKRGKESMEVNPICRDCLDKSSKENLFPNAEVKKDGKH